MALLFLGCDRLWQEHAQACRLCYCFILFDEIAMDRWLRRLSLASTRLADPVAQETLQTTLFFLFFTWFSWSEVISLGRIWPTGIVRGRVLVETPRAKFRVKCEVLIANCHVVRETVEFESSYKKNTEVSSCKLFTCITLLFEGTNFFQLFSLSAAVVLLNLYYNFLCSVKHGIQSI